MRTMVTTAAMTAALLTSGLLPPAQALGRSLDSRRWTPPTGVIACHPEREPKTKPQVFTFSRSTDEATVLYVGRECLTLLIAGGDNNLTVGADLGTYYSVALTPSTSYLVGNQHVSFAHLFASPESLTSSAGRMESVTVIGRFDGNYAPLRATRIVFLRKGQRLPG